MQRKILWKENPHRRLKSILKQLADRQAERSAFKLKSIVDMQELKAKQNRSMHSSELFQPVLLPTRASYGQFSAEPPISSNERYLDEKIRLSILDPERKFNTQPNVQAGSIVPKRCSVDNDQQILSRKFEEYSQLIDEQSGQKKYQRNHLKNIYNLSLCDRKKNVIRKTLFHRFPLDKYHFYVPQTIKHENFVKELRSLKPSPERSLKNTERKMTRHSIEDYNSFESTSQNKLKPFNLQKLQQTEKKSLPLITIQRQVSPKKKNLDSYHAMRTDDR